MFDRVCFAAIVCVAHATLHAGAQVPEWNPELAHAIAADALATGSAERGLSVFGSVKTACVSCHRIGKHGGTVGPDLSKIGKDRTPEEIVEAILWPSRKVADEYKTLMLVTTDGLQVKGYPVKTDAGHVAVRDPATGKVTQIATENIEEHVVGSTLMPDALATAMTPQQLNDVVRLLTSLGKVESPDPRLIDTVLSHSLSHAPAQFPYDIKPLRPDVYPQYTHHVNRDRIYDFYAKQAEFFRKADFRPPLLAPFPGLDGGTLGHWGNQNEEVWANDDWNKTDHGRLMSGVVRGEGLVITRGICVRLGEQGEVSACFDPDTLSWVAACT